MKLVGMAFLCGWLVGALATTENRVVTAETKCGVSVTYQIAVKQWMCLSHNASEPVLSILQQKQRVIRQFLLSASPEQLPILVSPATLRLRAEAQFVCFTLSVGRCERSRERSRVARSVQYTGTENNRTTSPLLLVLFGVFSMAALASLAIVTFLCCPTEARRQTQNSRASKLSKREKWEENTYNITDSENPLRSDDCSSFLPAKPSLKAMLPPPLKKSPSMEAPSQAGCCVDSCVLANAGKVSVSQPALLDQVESSLDYGLRRGSSALKTHHSNVTSSVEVSVVSSMHSLGPRVSPDGSSCLLHNGDSQPKLEHPTHSHSSSPFGPSPHTSPTVSVPTPPHHVRQLSTPVSSPQPPSPPSSPPFQQRPVSIATVPGDNPLARSLHAPVLPHPPSLPPHTSSSPPLSPVSLADSEVVSTGRVHPYHVVCQPSPSPAPAPSPTHIKPLMCTTCGGIVDGGEVECTDKMQEEEELNPCPAEKEADLQPVVCEACQSNSLYQEVGPSDDECLSSPPSSPTHIPDPVYERISSIRRHHIISPSLGLSSHEYSAVSSETAAQAYEKPRMATPPLLDCALPLSPNLSGRSMFPHSSRSTLPSRSESFHSNHEYESLPSSLNLPLDRQDSSLYAHINPVEEDEPESPPYVPQNSQRAQMLKIDSQGYALIVNQKEEEEVALVLAPAPGLTFPHLTPTQWSRVPSDYEVPIPANLSPAPPSASSSLAPSSIPANQSLPQPLQLRQAVVMSESSATSDHSPSLLSPPAAPSLVAEKSGSKEEASVSEYCLLSPARHSTISSGQGGNRDSVFVSISEATGSTEEDGALEVEGNGREREGRKIGEIVRKQRGRKIYEVENRDRCKSFCTSLITKQQSKDHEGQWKSQSLNIFISFNEDSQIV